MVSAWAVPDRKRGHSLSGGLRRQRSRLRPADEGDGVTARQGNLGAAPGVLIADDVIGGLRLGQAQRYFQVVIG